MASKKPVWFDPSQQAANHLNSVLQTGSVSSDDLVILDERIRTQELEQQEQLSALPGQIVPDVVPTPIPEAVVSVAEARGEMPLLEHVSSRSATRLLLITKDISVMQEGSAAYRKIIDQRALFQEIHIVVCNLHRADVEDTPVMRLFDTVWLYTTNSTSWWKLGLDAYQLGESQLAFGGGFRADVIVAEDLFESGLAGWFLANKHKRPFQIHISDDFFDQTYVDSLPHPTLYEWSVRYLLARVRSVRTKTEFQRQAVVSMHAELAPTTEVLPSYHNLEAWRSFVPTLNLRERYSQFKFIILAVSSMKMGSHTSDVIAGAAKILRRYTTVGLVVVGGGPLRTALERQAIALGLQNQIEFEPMPPEVISYMKSANVFIHLSEDAGEDEYILEATVSKIPIVAQTTGLAGSLLVDGKSAYLCTPGDVACVANGINRYLNDNQDRASFALNASDTVFERVEQDYDGYIAAYHQSIERCITEAS
jgi:glycosyltransferase involved in cell wall biosynthesis